MNDSGSKDDLALVFLDEFSLAKYEYTRDFIGCCSIWENWAALKQPKAKNPATFYTMSVSFLNPLQSLPLFSNMSHA